MSILRFPPDVQGELQFADMNDAGSNLGCLLCVPIGNQLEVNEWCQIAAQQGTKDFGAELCTIRAQALFKEFDKH